MKIDIDMFIQTLTKSFAVKRLTTADNYISYDTDMGCVIAEFDGDTITSVYTIDLNEEPYEQLYPPIF